MADALILGGTGVIGRAIAAHLAAASWRVKVAGRNPANMPAELRTAGVDFIAADRADAARLRAAIGDGVDLLVDCVCYTATTAHSLVELAADAGSTVLMSSKAVYIDAAGNHANSQVEPRFDGPINESAPTLTANDIDYRSHAGYGPNKVAAEQVSLDSGQPISILRPSRVHGIGGSRPREWVFVKRILDRRTTVLLARRGTGVVHTTAAANIAALVETVAHTPGARILNIADPDSPSALDISRTIANHLDHQWKEVLLDDQTDDRLGATPWDSAHPVVLDTSAAAALGYRPTGDYATTVAAQIDWLLDAAETGDRSGILPAADDPYFGHFFDYATEDRFLARVC
ncbi:NAD-dependent epimerase/dehydratase family protein [Nocardia sp. NPDC057440]|uniref:NAD-dependent epimerase/dehydratase family protein n=1 Tax=Nocardia sp. NPDC057440 TaxID=3346134 RepID=UPI0036719B5A